MNFVQRARLILAEQLGCRASPRLVLEIDVSKLLPVVVAHNEAGFPLLETPWRWEAATSHNST
jgi:hypothetical protein